MVFWHKKKTTIQEMLDHEATFWNLTNDSNKLALPSFIVELKSITTIEINDLRKVKKELEKEEKVKLGLTTISPKFEKLEKELERLNQLLIKQIKVINKDTVKTMSEDEIKRHLQGNSSDLSEVSTQIRKLSEIVEEDLKEITEETQKEEERFELREDTIYDTKTKITWDRDLAKAGPMTWDNAMKYAKQEGKKLPTRKDFWNLINEEEDWNNETKKGYPNIEDMEKIGFINVGKAYYQWTSEEKNTSYAWYVNFGRGDGDGYDKADAFYVVCVRRD